MPDNGGTITDRLLLADLNDDGNPEGTPGKYLYASTTNTLTMVTASQAELRKLVRGPENSGYVDGMRDEEVLVSDSDPYSYRLRFGTTEYTEMTDIVVYDSLENYHPTGGGVQWRGTFQNVDASMAESLGIAPVIYYSTVSELDLSNEANKDLTNAAIWSVNRPADPSTITAVAFDLRKDSNEDDFVLPKNKTLSLYINMTAPADSEQFRAWVEQEAHAFNNVYLSDTLLTSNATGAVTETTQYIHQDYTKVGLKPLCKLKLTKTVTGAETDETFTFKITLTDAEGKPLTRMYEYGGVGVPDGRIYSGATIRLADGQSIIIRNLPQGAKYTIEETEYGDFTPTVPDNASGTLDPETMREVEFVNVYAPAKTYGFKLHKKDLNSDETLQGAVFQLKDKDGNTLSFDFDEDTHTYTYDPDGTVTKIMAYTNPLTTVKGLAPGTYKLTESNPPLGYARLNDTVTINIEAEKDASGNLTGNAVFSVTGSSYAVIAYETDKTDETKCEDRTTVTDDDDTNANGLSVHVEIRNLKGVSMPVTGSNNALLCMLSGFLILAGYGAYTLLSFRRRSRKRL